MSAALIVMFVFWITGLEVIAPEADCAKMAAAVQEKENGYNTVNVDVEAWTEVALMEFQTTAEAGTLLYLLFFPTLSRSDTVATGSALLVIGIDFVSVQRLPHSRPDFRTEAEVEPAAQVQHNY